LLQLWILNTVETGDCHCRTSDHPELSCGTTPPDRGGGEQCQGQVHRRGFRLGLPSYIENQCQGQVHRRGFRLGIPSYT
jgi:hypothetical protein